MMKCVAGNEQLVLHPKFLLWACHPCSLCLLPAGVVFHPEWAACSEYGFVCDVIPLWHSSDIQYPEQVSEVD